MGITRKSMFGFPTAGTPSSGFTVRAVPMDGGMKPGQDWATLEPGSAVSMLNLVPLDGAIIPRSRLSSINTIRSLPSIKGMRELVLSTSTAPKVWLSSISQHGILTSNGSISQASFVSAFGFGSTPTSLLISRRQYAQTYFANINENALVVTGYGDAGTGTLSYETMAVLYQVGGVGSAAAVFSYLTGAPKAVAVGAFDNYLIAFHTEETALPLLTRVRWTQRGSASSWTGEGAGFEDLLQMRGRGTAVVPTDDTKFLLFTDLETWTGVGAAYPAQFAFQAMDSTVGCPFPDTIQSSEFGVFFLGNDLALRVLPRGGGASQVVSQDVAKFLRRKVSVDNPVPASFGIYDPLTKIYHLFYDDLTLGMSSLAVNAVTGAWGHMSYSGPPSAGLATSRPRSAFRFAECMLVGDSSGTISSFNSIVGTDMRSDAGSAAAQPEVFSRWRSAPLGAELPANYKQVVQVDVDYRATSKSTLTIKVSQDGGNNFETGRALSLVSAPVAGRATSQMYLGGPLPTVEIDSNSTGYELHRLDVTMQIEGRG